MKEFFGRIGFLLLIGMVLSGLLYADTHAQESDTEVIGVWVDMNVPSEFTEMLVPLLATEDYEWVNDPSQARLRVEITGNTSAITSDWVYVPVVAFPSPTESVRYFEIQRFWSGDVNAMNRISQDGTPTTLILTPDVYDVMQLVLGEPAENIPLLVIPRDALVEEIWNQHPYAWSLLPFHQLSPEFKVLSVDGIDIFSDEFLLEEYPLRIRVTIDGEDQALGHAVEDLLAADTWQSTNRDSSKLTRLVLTGVTALTRATAHRMEVNGMTYPAEGIMSFIQDADILHTSNEVPFSDNCPPADPFLSTTIFCSDNRYMELLTHIGLDVVELTGNHVNDYGPGALRHSLDMYDEEDIGYYGGGRTSEEARQAWITEHNGNSFAFIGCNVPGPFKAWVSTEQAGAAPCDETFLAEELPRLAEIVDIVIMSVQQWEFYRYQVGREQVRQFTSFANLGADVVIGSQAHQPQGFSFVPREDSSPAFLHHGLGNLFFDQMGQIGTRQMFIDKLIIYDGQLVSVVLYTGLIEDYCCPRPMTADERANFLSTIFNVSPWGLFEEEEAQ